MALPEAGGTISKAELDSLWRGLSASLHDVMRNIESCKSVIDGLTEADLVEAGYRDPAQGGTGIALLKSAVADLGDLAAVFRGAASNRVQGAYDYRTFAGRLLGVGQH